MIDLHTAAHIAEDFLNRHFQLVNDRLVVIEPQETPDYWVFQYNSARYLETGNLLYAVVEGLPLYVSKHDGSIAT
ncbi:MAG: YrhB family protein [Anaerolineae bacterium]|nr:YrhB family protein [Anaerolineae bacterium]MDW8173041.1 YrhB domain-containing protein [Anaerolineae bacterium]